VAGIKCERLSGRMPIPPLWQHWRGLPRSTNATEPRPAFGGSVDETRLPYDARDRNRAKTAAVEAVLAIVPEDKAMMLRDDRRGKVPELRIGTCSQKDPVFGLAIEFVGICSSSGWPRSRRPSPSDPADPDYRTWCASIFSPTTRASAVFVQRLAGSKRHWRLGGLPD